jgi:cyanophycin synthetase
MRFTLLSVYIGRNIYGPAAAIRGRLELGELEQHTSTTLGEAFRTRLLEQLPGLSQHTENNKPFPGQLQAGLHPLMVLKHIITELQSLTGYTTEFIRILAAGKPGVYQLIIAYREKEIALRATPLAITLFSYLLQDGQRPANSVPTDFNPGHALEQFLTQARLCSLDHTSRAIVKAAEARDIPWFRISPEDRFIQFGQGRYRHIANMTISGHTGAVAALLSRDKSVANSLLGDMGLPVPWLVAIARDDDPLQAAKLIGYPLVVKPAGAGQGRGVSVGVTDLAGLKKAIQKAGPFGYKLVIEQFIPGDDHRLLVTNGKLVAAARKLPAQVIGDGRHTIEQLVEETNRDPRRGNAHENVLVKIRLDDMSDALLKASGYERHSIPAAGEAIRLGSTANISTGGTAEDCTDEIHPDNRRMAERAARGVGLDIAGIDFITPDITRSYREVGGAICEINSSPGVRPHIFTDRIWGIYSAFLDVMFPPGTPSRIPVAAITGTNGKTTTCRMVAHILETAGLTTGLATTDGVSIGGEEIVHRDDAGPRGARMVLMNPDVDAAVLETARGALIRHGLGFNECRVGAVLNITNDHLGFDGIETLDDMAQAKQLVVQAARGMAVLNADDARCAAMAAQTHARQVCYVTSDPHNTLVARHAQQGGCAVALDPDKEGQPIHLLDRGENRCLVNALEIPATLQGMAAHNITNALFAAAIAYGMGVSTDSIRKGLLGFSCSYDQAPGRTNICEAHPFTVIVDYAHNPVQVALLGQLVNAMHKNGGRRISVLCTPGNRMNEQVAEMTRAAANDYDHFICSRSDQLRGRGTMELQELLRDGLLQQGVDAARIEISEDEPGAVTRALKLARPGDILSICCADPRRTWQQVISFKPEL